MALREVKFTALIIESERGWGRKIDEVKEFDTEEERDQFIREYNAQNTSPTAPDWYMQAEVGQMRISPPDDPEKGG